jgi:hypothetical protein
MSSSSVVRGEFIQGSDIRVMARVVKHDNSTLTGTTGTPDCGANAVSLRLFDLNASDPTAAIYSADSQATSTFIKALGTVDGWTVDSLGANFIWVMSNATVFASTAAVGGHRYRGEVTITTTSFGKVIVVIELACRPLLGS